MTDSDDSSGEEGQCVAAFSFEGAKLAPSEVALLYGDKFTSAGKQWASRREKLSRIDGIISTSELSRTIWMAALLSIEAAGSIRFEIRPKISRLARRKTALRIALLDTQSPWPVASLERKTCRKLREGSWEPSTLVYSLLEQEGSEARHDTLRLIKEGLLERGLLTVKVSRRFGLIRSHRYRLSKRTLTMVPEHGIEDLMGLLFDTDARRTDLLRELRTEIDTALARARFIRPKHAAIAIAELASDFVTFFR